jgi:hypothetical protein
MNYASAIAVCSMAFSLFAQDNQAPAQAAPARQVAATPQPQQSKPAATSNLQVARGVIALNIVENEPENPGTEFPPEVKRLFCFTQIKGGSPDDVIEHRWYWQEDLMNTVSLNIKSSSWRTHSVKTIPQGFSGEWRVAVVDTKSDAVLQTIKFMVK